MSKAKQDSLTLTFNLIKFQESLNDADIVLDEIEIAVHKGLSILESKDIQRLCILIAARYSSAAGMLYSVIRHQEEQENLRLIQRDHLNDK